MCRWFATSSLIAGLLLANVCASEARTRPHYGGTLHVDTQDDPWQGRDSIGRRMVFDSLTRVDSSGAVLPALALRWQSQNGDHRWQFWLRPGVRFLHPEYRPNSFALRVSRGNHLGTCAHLDSRYFPAPPTLPFGSLRHSS